MVRAKFRVDSITKHAYGPATTIQFYAVNADGVEENQRYHKYTPQGSLQLTVDNPPAQEFFELGKFYYLDFSPAT